MSRTCPVPQCGLAIPPTHALCQEHWLALPRAARERIWESYEKLRGAMTLANIDAHHALIRAEVAAAAARAKRGGCV